MREQTMPSSNIASLFRNVEVSLLGRIGVEEHLTAEWLTELDALASNLRTAMRCGDLSKSDLHDVTGVLKRIMCFTSTFVDLEMKGQHRFGSTLRFIRQTIDGHSKSVRLPKTPPSIVSDGVHHFKSANVNEEQALNASYMRQWMMDHIHHPFPTADDKREISEQSNKAGCGFKGELRPEQCTLWFINSRRRSGWTAWARRFAGSDQNRIRAIVSTIQGRELPRCDLGDGEELEDNLEELVVYNSAADKHMPRAQLAALCKEEFTRVAEWIQQGPTERIGDWMDRSIAEGRALTSKSKRHHRQLGRRHQISKSVAAVIEGTGQEGLWPLHDATSNSRSSLPQLDTRQTGDQHLTDARERLRESFAPLSLLPAPPSSLRNLPVTPQSNIATTMKDTLSSGSPRTRSIVKQELLSLDEGSARCVPLALPTTSVTLTREPCSTPELSSALQVWADVLSLPNVDGR